MTRYQAGRIRLIRKRRTYTVKELAQLLQVHPRTIQRWHFDGLVAVERSHPLLFLGYDAKVFLKTILARRRQKLGPNQFFCMHCRQPRRSLPERIETRPTGKRIGNGCELLLLYGQCCVCGCKMVLFTKRECQVSRKIPLTPGVAESRL